jgi:hypothetical protein
MTDKNIVQESNSGSRDATVFTVLNNNEELIMAQHGAYAEQCALTHGQGCGVFALLKEANQDGTNCKYMFVPRDTPYWDSMGIEFERSSLAAQEALQEVVTTDSSQVDASLSSASTASQVDTSTTSTASTWHWALEKYDPDKNFLIVFLFPIDDESTVARVRLFSHGSREVDGKYGRVFL